MMNQKYIAALFLSVVTLGQAAEIEVPVDLIEKGTLKVSGIAPKGHSNQATYFRCELNPLALKEPGLLKIAKDSCVNPKTTKLNASTSVRPGVYFVRYAESIYPDAVVVSPRQETELKLVQLRVPKVSGAFRVEIFNDLSNDQAATTFVSKYWLIDYEKKAAFARRICSRNPSYDYEWSPFGKYCLAAYTSRFDRFKSTFIFTKDATFEDIYIWYDTQDLKISSWPEFKNYGRVKVSEPIRDGEYVLVFAGVYGAKFVNTKDEEQSSLTYGIKVSSEDTSVTLR